MKRFPYRIIFQHAGNRITVMAIAHRSRRPEYWRRTAE
jgi:mRNA-degrading endonuclease RelE of RelBE toxin-antitoxin system